MLILVYVFIGMSVISLMGLMVGALLNWETKKESRNTLWGVFWAGLVISGILIYIYSYQHGYIK